MAKNFKFSKSTGCFYPDDIKFSNIPSDAIPVSKEDFKLAMNRQIDESLDVTDGKLTIMPPQPPSIDQLRKDKLNAINNAFNDSLNQGFITSIGIKLPIWNDDIRELKIAVEIAQLLNKTHIAGFIDFDGIIHTEVDRQDALLLLTECTHHYHRLLSKKMQLCKQIFCVNENNLDTITWETEHA